MNDVPNFPLRWLYLDLNSYFASVEQQINPKLRGKPVAVVPVMTDATCAIAASYEAKAFGIKTGTPIYEAKKLCPDLICVLGSHEVYVDYHHRILDEINNHLPITVVASIDEAACRLMDNENAPDIATKIAKNIKRGIAENVGEYLRSSIGIAPNKYLAKIGTELEKPNGLKIISSADLPNILYSLKLRDLPGIGHSMEKRLAMNGITTLPQLWQLSPKQMHKIWHNIWGEKMWYMLRGHEIPDLETTRSTVGHSHVLSPELRAPSQANFVAQRLTLKASSRLRRLEHYCSRMTLSIRLEKGERFALETDFYRARDSFTLIRAMHDLWDALTRETKSARIKKISITLSNLTKETEIQPDLIESIGKQKKLDSLSFALDKINHKYGRDSVTLGMLPNQGRSFSGTKIAFTRIPDYEEFNE